MPSEQSTIERAFDLARNGTCRNMTELRAQLKAEKCVAIDDHLAGLSITRQLRAIMKSSA